MNIPTISICIATLNRATFLAPTLESIITQCTDDVEIVIVDGASTDNTQQVVLDFKSRFPSLHYLRLDKKGGVDQDYCRAVELAQGEYCWLFTDDDLLRPGAIQTVLKAIHEKNYSLIILNAEVKNADLSKCLEIRRLTFSENQIYLPGDEERFFVETAFYLSFIGCVIIRRAIWNERNKQPYWGTEFVHVGVIFQAPLPDALLVIADPLILMRYGNSLWTSRSFAITLFKWPDLIWSFPQFSEEAKLQVSPHEPWRDPKKMLVFRARGAFSLLEYLKWCEPRLSSRLSRFIAKIIAQFPGCIANLLLLTFFSIFHSQSRLRIVDLQNSPFYYRNCLKRLSAKVFIFS